MNKLLRKVLIMRKMNFSGKKITGLISFYVIIFKVQGVIKSEFF